MRRTTFVFFLLVLAIATSPVAAQKNPSFEEVISLRNAGSPQISPDGKHVAFTVTSTDWKANGYDTEIWLSKNGGEPFQLTRTAGGSSSSPKWSPDGKWIAFTAKRGERTQIYIINPEGGEAWPLTNAEQDIQSFEWAPSGKQIAFTMAEKESPELKKQRERYGAFAEDDAEFSRSWLYLVDFQTALRDPSELPCYNAKDSTSQSWPCIEWPAPKALIDSAQIHVVRFLWSPDGKTIAVQHQPDPLINSSYRSDISLLDVATRKLTPIIQNPSTDGLAAWSPNGGDLLFTSAESDTTSYFYKNTHLFRLNLATGRQQRLGADFDENLLPIRWTAAGIFASASVRTEQHLLLIDPVTGKVSRWASPLPLSFGGSVTSKGDLLTFSGTDGKGLSEIYLSPTAAPSLKKITRMNDQIQGWAVAQSEVVRWRSQDGAAIEGVLHKPQNYDPTFKYPLLVVIHGGPTGVDQPGALPGSVYPIVQWLNKGALVLRVNYRGSAGYGEAFRSLNVRNLGVGDAWDVLSGVDYLIGKGMVDSTRMGCMGWSQGGYISAFLTTTSNRFKAISVGAGISNWMTYYVNTDIHPFTRQYLKATPWSDPEIYAKTSPMTYINQASTPTLIQHGEFDRRVPIPNAYELLQGLQDRGVPAKLIVYKGFGHGITKPKERLAAVTHNWEWFGEYVWGR